MVTTFNDKCELTKREIMYVDEERTVLTNLLADYVIVNRRLTAERDDYRESYTDIKDKLLRLEEFLLTTSGKVKISKSVSVKLNDIFDTLK